MLIRLVNFNLNKLNSMIHMFKYFFLLFQQFCFFTVKFYLLNKNLPFNRKFVEYFFCIGHLQYAVGTLRNRRWIPGVPSGDPRLSAVGPMSHMAGGIICLSLNPRTTSGTKLMKLSEKLRQNLLSSWSERKTVCESRTRSRWVLKFKILSFRIWFLLNPSDEPTNQEMGEDWTSLWEGIRIRTKH